ncbi:3-methylcrotonoyl-CoA carboxylase alpha subunit /biotin carboxylase /acetyl-CoA carboxylase carboxyltransferase subunit alpha [Tahibacter aquaticus]|uniref:Biotin carboxylase n=1 Tax=Tahibacter aquaticus TaxID=520092 RepID=A0A4R6YY74_9GAMM|nr:3-methylcrotonoyl-CoA carboxylase alpha subunit /biotin carboxylase /acetyl-CoA carboxylase carboxyltransferase subunit alpha [Tahibacter aquaticus]
MQGLFSKVLIANRGEIACRVIRTCRRLGIATVAVYSEADATAQHVRLADEAWPIGGSRPAESYLRGDVILEAAKRSGAQAIHPGYGFLSENAEFAEAVEAAGIVFIGPSAASMRKMGSKAGAKILMQEHKVPVVPGYTGEDQDPALLAREASRIGFPLMIKAAHGGGGKGMRIVHNAGEFAANLESCQREARNAFGRDRVLLERYVEKPRHIEFQVFGDRHGNIVHLNERECSAQRRYQKVLEEAPSPFVTTELRTRMGDAAIAAARAIDYSNAGTVEFIVGQGGDFYFMEINTRLQVEHPVTELTLNLDLVELQLRVAAGEALPGSLVRNKSVPADGHAIELRLYAEDPAQNFLPGSGKLTTLRLPAASRHVRIDGGVIQGDTVSIFYDPMIAKLIVWDKTRAEALQRMREALAETEIVGPKSNVEFLERLVRHAAVTGGTIDTGYLDRHLDEFLPQAAAVVPAHLLAAAASVVLLDQESAAPALAATGNDPYSPWARADGWRLGHPGKRVVALVHAGERLELAAHGNAGQYRLDWNGQHAVVKNAAVHEGWLSAEIDGTVYRLRAVVEANHVLLHDGNARQVFERAAAFAYSASKSGGGDRVVAPMPGRVVLTKVQVGDTVIEGQELAIMEAMKMEITLRAPRAGTIAAVQAQAGEFVEADAVLIRLEAV